MRLLIIMAILSASLFSKPVYLECTAKRTTLDEGDKTFKKIKFNIKADEDDNMVSFSSSNTAFITKALFNSDDIIIIHDDDENMARSIKINRSSLDLIMILSLSINGSPIGDTNFLGKCSVSKNKHNKI
jgi:hypothetical protein